VSGLAVPYAATQDLTRSSPSLLGPAEVG
jgi:hypothetical protein